MNKTMLSFVTALMFCLSAYAQDIVPMHNEKGLFGYGEKGSKTFTIKPQWDMAQPFNEYGVAMVRKGTRFGLIDKSGKPVGPNMGYTMIAPYDGTDYWLVAVGGKRTDALPKNRINICTYGFKGSTSYPIKGASWGILGKDGKPVVKPVYPELGNLMGGRLLAYQDKGGMYGWLSIDGDVVYPAQYNVITPFNNQGIAAMRNRKNGRWSLVDLSGKVIIPEDEMCEGFGGFCDDSVGSLNILPVSAFLEDKKLWKDDYRLMPLLEFNITWVNSQSPYVVSLKHAGGKKGEEFFVLYDLSGHEVVTAEVGLDDINAPSEGVSVAKINGKLGFLDLSTLEFVPGDNSRTYLPFSEGYSISFDSVTGKSFCIVDKKGNKVSGVYDEMTAVDDRFIVKSGENYGIVTRHGKEILPVSYKSVKSAGHGIYGVSDANGKYGYADADGKFVIPMSYDDGLGFVGGYAIVSKDGHYGVIDGKNNVLVPFNYSKMYLYVDDAGNPCFWAAESENEKFSVLEISTYKKKKTVKAVRQTDLTDIYYSPAVERVVARNEAGLYGILEDGKFIVPCSVSQEEHLVAVLDYMSENNLAEIKASEARKVAVWTNDARNSFKITDTISDDIWDF